MPCFLRGARTKHCGNVTFRLLSQLLTFTQLSMEDLLVLGRAQPLHLPPSTEAKAETGKDKKDQNVRLRF